MDLLASQWWCWQEAVASDQSKGRAVEDWLWSRQQEEELLFWDLWISVVAVWLSGQSLEEQLERFSGRWVAIHPESLWGLWLEWSLWGQS